MIVHRCIVTSFLIIPLLLSHAVLADIVDRPVEIRAIWVTRWDYKNPEDIKAIVDNCVSHNFNVILFQVRGNGTVFYKSDIEPWGWELTSDSPKSIGQDPGWDPLQFACEEAHKQSIELHAYMNVFPGWRGGGVPLPEVKQLWNTHPEWFMVDRMGKKMTPKGWYSFLSPGIPEVKDYIQKVFLEVIERYKPDGIHFDYIRYPSEIDDFSYDRVSVERFKLETGKTPGDVTSDWRSWRAEQVTQIEQSIYRQGKALRPDLIFSAAVIDEPTGGRYRYFQDSERWMREKTLDVVMPMIYKKDLEKFRKATVDFVSIRQPNSWVAPGISLERADDQFIAQLESARALDADGCALFAYSILFKNNTPNEMASKLINGPYRVKALLPWHPAPDTPRRSASSSNGDI